jgi:hypothetical protein
MQGDVERDLVACEIRNADAARWMRRIGRGEMRRSGAGSLPSGVRCS